MKISAVARSHIGRIRSRNEDAFLADTDASLYAVADGMGGHASGDVASQTAIDAFHAAFLETRSVLAAMKSANRAVLERAQREPQHRGMGTTLTGVHLFGNAAFVAHVGDSRLYRLRAGNFEQLTTDHTVAQDMIEQGALTRRDSMQHPASSMLKRSLGLRASVDVDVFQCDVAAHDLLLICSDGLTGMVWEDDIHEILAQGLGLDEMADQLIEAANLRGGVDNITALLLRCS
jgi:PPM family protein phosphatase